MTRAYRKSYLDKAAEAFGDMMDYAVTDCGYDGDWFLLMFTVSGLAVRFERGDPEIVMRKSGTELVFDTIRNVTGKAPKAVPMPHGKNSAEYWAGKMLAYYQWYTAGSFASILRFLPFSEIVKMHTDLGDGGADAFFDEAGKLYLRENPQTNLQRYRKAAGLTKQQLSKQAGVSPRSVDAYERRERDINKAQAIVVMRLARALGCSVEELLELQLPDKV